MSNKDKIRALLKSIESGDPEPIAVVNEAQYIQHNPQTQEGSEGLAVLFKRLSETSPRVNIVRAFEDGPFVFAHTEYDFSRRNIGFEVFRFEAGQAVEHWDNIQERLGPNPSGHSMVDGPTESQDRDKTEANRDLIQKFVKAILIEDKIDRLSEFVDGKTYTEHNPRHCDGMAGLRDTLQTPYKNKKAINYIQMHRILAEGNFVLSICEGTFQDQHSAFYDLYRIESGKIVEHWDTTEKIAPRDEWKNDNGKF